MERLCTALGLLLSVYAQTIANNKGPHPEIHQVVFENDTSKTNVSFGMAINRLGVDTDLYYVLLGHPTSDAHNMGQLNSYNNVFRQMSAIGRSAHAAAINKDMPAPDHKGAAGESFFGDVQHLRDSHLVERAKEEASLDFTKPQDEEYANFDFLGMAAFSWTDCITQLTTGQKHCIRILQIRNSRGWYPSEISVNQTTPVFEWLRKKIQDTPPGHPLIFLFQSFNSEVITLIRQVEAEMEEVHQPLNILGVFFSLQNRPINIKKKMCREDQWGEEYSSPIINFGALKGGEYLMLQFDPSKYGAKSMYKLDVRHAKGPRGVEGKVTVVRPHPWDQLTCFGREKTEL